MYSCHSSDYTCYHGYLATIVCCFGIVTNGINIVVWSRQKNQSSVNLTLKILSVSNFLMLTAYLVLVSYLFLATGPNSKFCHDEIGVYTILIANHIALVCRSWSSWNVIVLASFRLYKINFPVHSRTRCTLYFAKIILACVCVFDILGSIINFRYYDVISCDEIEGNKSCNGYWLMKSTFVTDGRLTELLSIHVYALCNDLLPLSVFMCLCIGMAFSLIKLARNKNSGDHYSMHAHSDFFQKTVGLFVLLILFTASLLPVPIVVYGFSNKDAQFFFFMDGSAKLNLLDLVQYLIASIDILVYIPMSRGYRRELRRLFCCGNDDQDDKNEEDIGPRVMWPAERAPLFE